MKKILIYFLFGTMPVFVTTCKKSDPSGNCGGKARWSVKVLTDGDASKINFTPTVTTVSALRQINPGISVGYDTKRFGIEFNTYTIQCKIRIFKTEDDADLHFILEDLSDTTKTMLGEIPDPKCNSVKSSSHAQQFADSRTAIQPYESLNGTVNSGTYEITGVAFFDDVHGQTGVAPNGIELHPILSIVKK